MTIQNTSRETLTKGLQTFLAKIDNNYLESLIIKEFDAIKQWLLGFGSGVERARMAHSLNEEAKKESASSSHEVTCKKGCHFCCHLSVEVTNNEVDWILHNLSHSEKIEALEKSEPFAEMSSEDYLKIPFQQRKCIPISSSQRNTATKSYLVRCSPVKTSHWS